MRFSSYVQPALHLEQGNFRNSYVLAWAWKHFLKKLPGLCSHNTHPTCRTKGILKYGLKVALVDWLSRDEFLRSPTSIKCLKLPFWGIDSHSKCSRLNLFHSISLYSESLGTSKSTSRAALRHPWRHQAPAKCISGLFKAPLRHH